MLKIRQLQKQKKAEQEQRALASDNKDIGSPSTLKISAAQLRVQKDITELNLPANIKLSFPRTDDIMNFNLSIRPIEGYYKNGTFRFHLEINDNFPMEPPKVKCVQKIYHPNIDFEGNICLNILREDWSPVLNLHSIIIGLQFLFLEPNPTDPLNKEAANELNKNLDMFKRNVSSSMRGGYVSGETFDCVV